MLSLLFYYVNSGFMPPSIRNLRLLSALHIDNNKFSGELDSIFSLPSLVFLYASNNRFSGRFPVAACDLREQLQYILCDGNSLTGTLPPCLGDLQLLELLFLDDNSLSGSIPASFGKSIT